MIAPLLPALCVGVLFFSLPGTPTPDPPPVPRQARIAILISKAPALLTVHRLCPDAAPVTIDSIPVCMMGSSLGPKLRRGDWVTPEGFYRVTHLNAHSRFHLSMGINYPNAEDRARLGRESPAGTDLGDDIFIHGDCVSAGCVALGDKGIERLYTRVEVELRAGHAVPVIIVPERDPIAMERLAGAVRADSLRTAPYPLWFADWWMKLLPRYRDFLERSLVP